MSISVNTANNQIQGIGLAYDANGNTTTNFNGGVSNTLTYDAENRVSTYQPYIGLTTTYAYDTQNRRIWSWPGTTDTWGNVSGYTVNIYTPSGQKLAAYTVGPSVNDYNGQATPFMASGVITSDQYFGSRRLALMDQLGSGWDVLSVGRKQGQHESAGYLELRHVLAGFRERTGLCEQPLLLQCLWPLHDAGPVSLPAEGRAIRRAGTGTPMSWEIRQTLMIRAVPAMSFHSNPLQYPSATAVVETPMPAIHR